ncbi:hypothetical protein [Paenibacillus naphthalenovorans]|uniref:hypothetical protein n=1 Tax=Paenibacillus naphthalenovorans TaxID=162209 RepID=UPI003D2D397F
MDQEEYYLRNCLSQGEQLVYHYLKEEAARNGGFIKQSMKQIGNEVFERYRDQIKYQLPPTRADKPFSEATVHRAIRKLSLEGIVGIVPSTDKAECNTIRFYGHPQADELIGELVNLVDQLNQQMQRFQSVMNRKNREIERMKRDCEYLHQEVNELLEGYEELTETQIH